MFILPDLELCQAGHGVGWVGHGSGRVGLGRAGSGTSRARVGLGRAGSGMGRTWFFFCVSGIFNPIATPDPLYGMVLAYQLHVGNNLRKYGVICFFFMDQTSIHDDLLEKFQK